MQMHHTISGVTGPRFTKFVTFRSNFFVNGVDATIRVAIRPFIVDYQSRHLKSNYIGKT